MHEKEEERGSTLVNYIMSFNWNRFMAQKMLVTRTHARTHISICVIDIVIGQLSRQIKAKCCAVCMIRSFYHRFLLSIPVVRYVKPPGRMIHR